MVQVAEKVIDEAPHVRCFYTRVELTNVVVMGQRGVPVFVDPFGQPTTEATGIGVASALLEIPGVVVIQMFPYHVLVEKSPMWQWDEIKPGILRLLASMSLDVESVVKNEVVS